ncbi:hypothetical protein V8J88_09815 [Massilia sp. W12]|uniref:hypothetical protein n=1 Tax=Massilia sp. W12 TaxID=3126507 RepID=UPI0030D51A2B
MKLLCTTFFCALLLSIDSMAANANIQVATRDEPAYGQTQYAARNGDCSLIWIVRTSQGPAFSVREMRACKSEAATSENLQLMRRELLTVMQTGTVQALAQASEITESKAHKQEKLPPRLLSDMRVLSVGRLEEMPDFRQSWQQALSADQEWQRRISTPKAQANLALEKLLLEIANRENVFSELGKIFEEQGYRLKLRNIEKLRLHPDGALLDCQLFFSLAKINAAMN